MLPLLTLLALAQTQPAVRRSTPAADDPGLVVRPAGTVNVNCVGGCSGGGGGGGGWFPDGGSIGYMLMPDGGALEVYVTGGTVNAAQSGTWNINNITGTVSLPTGASTSALQTAGNASLASIDAKTPPLGQTTMANSSPVTIASDQTAVPASQSGVWNVRAQDGVGNPLASSTSAPTGTEQALIVRNIPSGTQAVSGTVNAVQGGTWNLNNITGTVSLPTGAATEATLGTRLSDSTFTSRFPAASLLGDATANPTTTGTASFLFGYNGSTWDRLRSSTANGLLVEVSRLGPGTNYIGKTRLTDGTLDLTLLNSAPGSDTGQVAVPVRVISSLASGGGGTSSSFGAAFPATGTAAGFFDGTNMVGARTFDLDSSAGVQNVLGVSLRVTGSGGSSEVATGAGATTSSTLRVVLPTDQTPIPATVTGTVTANAGTGNFTVVQPTASNLRAQTSSESNVNAALPAQASTVAYSDGANAQVPRVYDADTSAGTYWATASVVTGPASGGVNVATVAATAPTSTATGLYVRPVAKGVSNPVTTAVTCSTSATPAPSSALTGRTTLTLLNNGTSTIYIGGSTVTTSNGLPLLPGASFTDDVANSSYYCIVASGTGELRVLEN